MYIDGPTRVQIGIYVNSFYSFNEQTMVCVGSQVLREIIPLPRTMFCVAILNYGTLGKSGSSLKPSAL